MGKTLRQKQDFGQKLRLELDRQSVGVRTLARRLTSDRNHIEVVRRRLNKYLREGVTPTEATRHEIEAALELDRDALKPDGDDDEDADPSMKLRRIRAELILAGREDLAADLLALTVPLR